MCCIMLMIYGSHPPGNINLYRYRSYLSGINVSALKDLNHELGMIYLIYMIYPIYSIYLIYIIYMIYLIYII